MLNGGMRRLYAQSLTKEERAVLPQSLESRSAFTVQRCIDALLSVDEQLKTVEIGRCVVGSMLSDPITRRYPSDSDAA